MECFDPVNIRTKQQDRSNKYNYLGKSERIHRNPSFNITVGCILTVYLT